MALSGPKKEGSENKRQQGFYVSVIQLMHSCHGQWREGLRGTIAVCTITQVIIHKTADLQTTIIKFRERAQYTLFTTQHD